MTGFATYEQTVDDDSIDMGIASRASRGSVKSPRLELQLKCSSSFSTNSDSIPFRLSVKNFTDLRGEDFQVPRILVLVLVPENVEDWLMQSSEEMVLRHCGYWLSLREEPETNNENNITISIPKNQPFTVNALRDLMSMISNGGKP